MTAPEQLHGSAGARAALGDASPSERRGIVLRLIAEHPDGVLDLGTDATDPAMLDEVDLTARPGAGAAGAARPPEAPELVGARLRGASLRLARLAGVSLTRADLAGATLGGADLTGAVLEDADLHGADLSGATLTGARLGRARLRDAMLEDANLEAAAMRFAELQASVLEGANLRRADLWGAHLDEACLVGADLRQARLEEAHLGRADLSGAQLQGANLRKADLAGANLTGANLEGATLAGANLAGAVLRDARLERLSLIATNIQHVHVSDAWLDGARLEQAQLGGMIGEEIAGDHRAAARGYLALERNFAAQGNSEASSWAYRRRRRMQKLAARAEAADAIAACRWLAAGSAALRYATDQAVEWLCDYGESIPRVLRAMLVVYLAFAVVYAVTGSVVRVDSGGAGPPHAVTSAPMDVAIFSLLAMTTSGSPVIGLLPRDETVHILTGIEALAGIFLTGLLGFIVGNRIRR